jgi:menaquinone-dependent protoporphyrinogen oxidase
MRVLVAYATRHGATKGIAERIAAVLERAGLEVALAPVGETPPVRDFDAVVVGAAAYFGGWLGDATTFVRRNRRDLAGRPVWLFSSGPIGTAMLDSKGRDVVAASRPREFDEFGASIQPRSERVFFGALDVDAAPVGIAEAVMSRFTRLMPAIRDAMPAGDFRDWQAIEAWAEEIVRELAVTPAPTSIPT